MRPWQTVRTVIIVVGCLVIVAYSAFEARGIVIGPTLTISEPLPGETISEPLSRIIGTAERISKITLNGRPIFISEEGAFDEPLILSKGYNEILVEAWDRFDTKTSVMLPLIYQPKN